MYTITVDGYVLYDPRDDELIVESPKVNLEVNTVGDCSFVIHANHPYYGTMKHLKSVFEVSDDIGVIFRGRMTGNSYDFNNSKYVDLEGLMGCFNDTIVRPFAFPDDFLENAAYNTAANSGNVVAFFLKWLIDNHNSQKGFTQFKLGSVTVSDPNNYVSRSSTAYSSTWEVLKSKLFDSSLGGYLCIRYEADGNYIDYVNDFELTNTQEIVFGENLLDLKRESDSGYTYSAVIPVGATIETEAADGSSTSKHTVTIKNLADGAVTSDIVKQGDVIYSQSAVEAYGWIFAPVSETTWDDVTNANNLLTKAVEYLTTDGLMLTESVDVTAVDLHFTDEQISSFRIYRNVKVSSAPHGFSGIYQLPKIQFDLQNPQNTRITVGATKRTLTDINSKIESDTVQRIESVVKDIEESRSETTEVKNFVILQSTELINTCNQILMSALESYVTTSSYEEFTKTLKSELEVWAGGITGRVSATETSIQNVDGDLQQKFNTITKYFTFDINGLTIGQVDNPNKVVIDNDNISILVKNKPIQEFTADGTALIPILNVATAFNLLGLQITENETHINCDYIGG